MTSDGPQTTGSCFAALPEVVEQSRNPLQRQMNCKVEVHADTQHRFFLLSTGMTALFAQGRVAFGNSGLNPLHDPKAHCEAPLKALLRV